MNWKQWKRGLCVAMLTGALTGVLGLAVGITLEQAAVLVALSTAKDALLFLKSHPVESLQDTEIIRRSKL